jgi:SAM-dependent methyltransferase
VVNAPVTEALLAALDPRPEDTVLDLAGGTGELAQALSPRVARVLATDLSPAMVAAMRRRGIPNADCRVMDLLAIDLPNESVDAVTCRFGYMLVPAPGAALRETRRVLRRQGRLAFATWAVAARNPWATAYGPVLLERGLQEPAPPGQPGQFGLGEAGVVEELVRAAGFAAVAVEEVPLEFRFRDWDDYRDVMLRLAATTRALLEQLDGRTRAEVDEAARERLDRYGGSDGYVLPGLALVTAAA